ncbi:hypothetical protein CROQUDRAFT_43808 [Cronartium quercuum f. sp. fusiforme G11]|uniref:Histidinol-phosphatase n=1 Tax=Cronartium quercuum f. sp. fusiforme G11 TaxID=708437 RepID=A0A9P6NNQ2_9BASI|nr:hypothetical protein CROQUDRAFT_43808 [Cronartium quercuum f. sp. fusiforme G11]
MPISLHSHSGQFCKHATGQLDHVILTAIEKQFKSYGLSEHMPRNRSIDLYPEERDMDVDALIEQFDQFIIEATRLKAKYATKISLLIGIETEVIEDDSTFALLDQVLDKHRDSIDYLVGSVHHVNQIPIDFDKATFHEACRSLSLSSACDPPEPAILYELCSQYFDAQYRLMTRFQPEVIGHFDLCLLYYPELDLTKDQSVWDKVKRNVSFGISYGALFEVNSAALKKGWPTPYPGPAILHLICEMGGRLTLSDDSHGPHQVGLNYSGVLEYLSKHRIRSLWFLKPITDKTSDLSTEGLLHPRRRVRALLLSGEWSKHPSWSTDTS